jgi:hypothetical protein
MIYYDQMEHEYLWEVDMSPNNIWLYLRE